MLWKLKYLIRGIGCFFLGHEMLPGDEEISENDWCLHCLVDWPQDQVTLPRVLNRCFGWMVEREWNWFARIDDWLIENHSEILPDWWEY